MKVDSKGWKTLARTVRPVVEHILEDQVREAGYFVSLMSRLVITYPQLGMPGRRQPAGHRSRRAAAIPGCRDPDAETRSVAGQAGRDAKCDRDGRTRDAASRRERSNRRTVRPRTLRRVSRSATSGLIPYRIIAIRSRCVIPILMTPLIVPPMMATIGIQANHGNATENRRNAVHAIPLDPLRSGRLQFRESTLPDGPPDSTCRPIRDLLIAGMILVQGGSTLIYTFVP